MSALYGTATKNRVARTIWAAGKSPGTTFTTCFYYNDLYRIVRGFPVIVVTVMTLYVLMSNLDGHSKWAVNPYLPLIETGGTIYHTCSHPSPFA